MDSRKGSDHYALSSRMRPPGASLSPCCPRTGGGWAGACRAGGRFSRSSLGSPAWPGRWEAPAYPQRACAGILGACLPEARSQAVSAGLYSSALLVVDKPSRQWAAGATRTDSLPVLAPGGRGPGVGRTVRFLPRPLSRREDRHPLPTSSCARPCVLVWPHLLCCGHWSFGIRAHASDLGCLGHHIKVLISNYSDALSSRGLGLRHRNLGDTAESILSPTQERP